MKVAVATREGRVVEIRYLPPTAPELAPTSPLAERAAHELERYRDDPRAPFDLPLLVEGTPFQRRVWNALREIPCGETVTYGELARRVGGEARAVGQACGDNLLPIVVPCHRVVAQLCAQRYRLHPFYMGNQKCRISCSLFAGDYRVFLSGGIFQCGS